MGHLKNPETHKLWKSNNWQHVCMYLFFAIYGAISTIMNTMESQFLKGNYITFLKIKKKKCAIIFRVFIIFEGVGHLKKIKVFPYIYFVDSHMCTELKKYLLHI